MAPESSVGVAGSSTRTLRIIWRTMTSILLVVDVNALLTVNLQDLLDQVSAGSAEPCVHTADTQHIVGV